MSKTFTYIGDLSTALDYARFRLDDIDNQASVDETKSPSPFLWDETYLALMAKFGTQQGMVMAANAIAARVSKDPSSFRESGGIGVAWKDRAYYERIAKEIAAEPPFVAGAIDQEILMAVAQSSHMRRGVEDSYRMRKYNNEAPAFPLGVKEARQYRPGTLYEDCVPNQVEICGDENN